MKYFYCVLLKFGSPDSGDGLWVQVKANTRRIAIKRAKIGAVKAYGGVWYTEYAGRGTLD